jgi:hypothetical protein
MNDDQFELDGVHRHDQALVEEQIRKNARIVDYDIREYPIEVLVSKYLDGAETSTNEIFVPDYQRNFIWSLERQSRFIESVLVGLPIPYLFVADVGSDDEELAGRLEIVDGTQRIRTLAAFIHDQLELRKLEKLPLLVGLKFSDLLPSRQRRFRRTTIRLIELTEFADEETRRDMFDRINSGGEQLNPMETRRGVRQGPFLKLVESLSLDPRFRNLAPLSAPSVKRRDYDELVVRFFAYADRYEDFERSVIEFINDYIDEQQSAFTDAVDVAMRDEWNRMLDFVQKNFRYGFRKNATNTRTPRVRFEAIAVGVALALRQDPNIATSIDEVSKWAYGEEFNSLVSSDGANSRPRIRDRIEFVRDRLLKK